MKGLKNVNILTPTGIIHGHLEIQGEKIHRILTDGACDGVAFDEEVIVVPGFIDQHIHGVNRSDAMDGTMEDLRNMAMSLPKEGTTSFLPTTMTQSVENILKALRRIKEYREKENIEGAEVVGIHLEGPFINPEACGAQDPQYIVNPDIDLFDRFFKASGEAIKIVTLAPEQPGGFELIRYLTSLGVIASIGHTKATYEQTLQAIEAGARLSTHTYNAMTGLHHRQIGVVGAVLLHEELHAELIADGLHVHPKAIEILYKNKGRDSITLITDSLRAKGLPDGIYDLGGQAVTVQNGEARLPGNVLAGSTLRMIDAVKNVMRYLGLSLEDAVAMASTNPAKQLGLFDRKGSIEVGKDADLVVLNRDYDIVMTICRGRIAYQKH
ncbi:MAG TPA: N-acetylglucosamine-6-phosphate deacetylase [Haloplasmataceae bacterium]